VAAVRSGDVAETVIDDHVHRLLRLADRVGALGTPRSYPVDLPAPDSAIRKEQLTRLAAQGMTVLKNSAGLLPLHRQAKVALIGRHALETMDMGGGSAQVNPPYQTSVAEGMRALLGDAVTVTDGVEVRTRPMPARAHVVTDVKSGKAGVHFTLLAADGSVLDERHSPTATTLVGLDDGLKDRVSRIHLTARLQLDGPVQLGTIGVGRWNFRAANEVREYRSDARAGGFAEEIIAPPAHTFVVESGHGTVVEADVDVVMSFGLFGLIARPAPHNQDDVISSAARAAAAAEVAVVVVGLTEEQETEAVDKTTLHLPGPQDALVTAVAAAAKRTVVVVNAATPVIMPWIQDVDAVLWAGLPGQEGGHAVAAVLMGDMEPAGRLVTTFPNEDAATPAWSVTPVDREIRYTEGPFIGYRGHAAGNAPPPPFWFGHGLGYTTW
jgi:beta-glucosidase